MGGKGQWWMSVGLLISMRTEVIKTRWMKGSLLEHQFAFLSLPPFNL